MSTVARRTFRSTPHRDATETWHRIVDLLTRGKDGDARHELLAVTGIVSAVITDQAPKVSPIVSTCDGPRVRIYCAYDDDALDADFGDEAPLSFDALKGNWAISLPCAKGDLDWVTRALKKHSERITARDADAGITLDDDAAKAEPLTLNLEGLKK